MFEQTFKNIDDILHKDAGCTSELDYTVQSSWQLFLRIPMIVTDDSGNVTARSGDRDRRSEQAGHSAL